MYQYDKTLKSIIMAEQNCKQRINVNEDFLTIFANSSLMELMRDEAGSTN